MEYLNYINDFKKSIQSQISEFSFKVENYVAEIENKNKHFEKLEEHINNQQNEISNYHKVSFVKQLDKQLEEQKKITEVHKLRLKSVQKINQTLREQNVKLKEGVCELNYQEFDDEFISFIQNKKKFTKAKLVDEIYKLYSIIRGEKNLTTHLQNEEARLAEKTQKKKKPKIKKQTSTKEVENVEEEKDDEVVEEKQTSTKEVEDVEEEKDDEVVEDKQQVEEKKEDKEEKDEEVFEEKQQVKEELQVEDKGEQVQETTEEPPIEDTKINEEEPTQPLITAEVLDSIYTFKNVDYNEIHYKDKTYYLNKSTNIIYRKRKSGKVGKEYGKLNDDFTIIKS